MVSILENIAARLNRKVSTTAEHENRFGILKAGAEPPVLPAMPEGTLDFFRQQSEKNLFEVAAVSDLSLSVAGLQTSLPVVLSPQQSIQVLPWRDTELVLTDNPEAPALGIIEADWGIAETGTVVTDSSQVASRLLFLAEELLVILRTARILRVQEELWKNLGTGRRAIHLISGPSRTADVEQTLQVGAHGPRRVYLWLVA